MCFATVEFRPRYLKLGQKKIQVEGSMGVKNTRYKIIVNSVYIVMVWLLESFKFCFCVRVEVTASFLNGLMRKKLLDGKRKHWLKLETKFARSTKLLWNWGRSFQSFKVSWWKKKRLKKTSSTLFSNSEVVIVRNALVMIIVGSSKTPCNVIPIC